MVGVASPERNKLPQLFSHSDGVCGVVGELVGVVFLGADAGTVATSVLGILVLPFLLCFVGDLSVAYKEVWMMALCHVQELVVLRCLSSRWRRRPWRGSSCCDAGLEVRQVADPACQPRSGDDGCRIWWQKSTGASPAQRAPKKTALWATFEVYESA